MKAQVWQGLAQDFAQRSEVLIMACSQRAIDAYTHDGNHVLCGDSSDGFEIFATKNEKAAIVLGATKFTDWERTDPNNRTVFTRCYRWDSGTILCVSYVLKQSGGGEIYISY